MGRRSRKIRIVALVFTCSILPLGSPQAAPAECRLARTDCVFPFPDDRLLQKSSRSASGRKWAYKDAEYQGLWALAHADGFSPLSHIWIEAPCDLKGRFPEHFGVDPGQRFWLWNTGIEKAIGLTVKFHRGALCLLEAVPDETLRPGDTHLLVVRDLRSDQGRLVELSTAFDQQDPGDPLYGDRVALLPGGVPRQGIQTIVQLTVRSYENLLGTFLHLRNTAMARFEPNEAPVFLEKVQSANGFILFHGRVAMPWICQRELATGVCRFHVSPTGRARFSSGNVTRSFFVSIPAAGASGSILIPALVYQQPDVVAALSGMQKILSEARLAAFGFTDQRAFLAENRRPLDGLPPSLPGYFLTEADHDRLTSVPDREAVRILHGILLSQLMTDRIPREISKILGRPVRLESTRGLALETQRDTFALSVNPFVDKTIVIAAPVDQRGLPFGPQGTLPEKEFVRLFWDGMDFPNYTPILKSRKSMPDTTPQAVLVLDSLFIESERREAIRFLRN